MRLRTLRFTALAAVAAWLFAVAAPASAGTLARQSAPSGYGNFATTYDNFTLGSTSDIAEFQWIGAYFNPPVQGPITGFTLNFYADNGGAPGATLASYSGPGTFGETSVGPDASGDPSFFYDGFLGSAFTAQAGTTYWVSIVADLVFPPQWGWETGVGGDGAGYQCFFGACGATPNDLSFAILDSGGNALYAQDWNGGGAYASQNDSGAPTPEPGTLVMLGSGILGIAGTLRRKLF